MTPKTLDKYIAALKKKAAAEGWTFDQYSAELNKIHSEMSVQYLADKITSDEYAKVMKQISNAKKNPGLLGKKDGMTGAEYAVLEEGLKKKKQAGMITADEFSILSAKLKKGYSEHKKAETVEKEIGVDPGTLATADAVISLTDDYRKIYGQAEAEMTAKLKEFTDKYGAQMKELEMKFIDGTITEDELKWQKEKLLQEKILKQKIDQSAGVLLEANKKALALTNGEQLQVFAENANYQSFQINQDVKMDLMFSVYDESTVENLIKSQPELLPRKEVNGVKDQAWNRRIIANAVAQAVIQGEPIPSLARRIAVQTGETNMKAMTRYARTAMTSAQNSGRMEMLHRAQGLGVQCKKVWLATLDSRTRDSHQHMDGKKADVDEKFPNGLMFPGDPNGIPAEVYNCRCTLIYDYEGFPNDPTEDQRLMYEEWDEEVPVTKKDKNGKEYQATEIVHHRESRLITDMTYDEWKAAKEGSQLNQLNLAKQELAQLQKQIVTKGISESKVYKDLWKDPVTLADYPTKKAGIQAKLDYYDTEIDKYKQAQASGSSWATDEKIKELEKKRKLLKEFEQRGQLIEKRDAALAKVKDIYQQVGYGGTAAAPAVAKKAKAKAAKPAAKPQTPTQSLGPVGAMKTPFGPEAYSQERKDKALWSTDKAYVDSVMRGRTGEVWSKATAAEKDAIVEYTQSYHKFNEPLRGYEYGTSRYLGVGNTDLNASYANNGKRLNAMTDLIDKCSYDHDMWLQRGCGYGGMDKFFMCSADLLQNGSEEELRQALLGTMPTEYAFGSMGSAKGKGFSSHPIIMNIYAPSGTKMMYVEPFSHYGGHMYHWDGKEKQSHFGDEFETLLQQGTQFRVTKVERKRRGGTIYFDLEVINQDTQQRWKR
jgi:SPP1 gp7 family putative phage head morphogenesis protein